MIKKKRAYPRWCLFLPIGLILLMGCAGKGIKTVEGDPETLYRQGLTRFNKRDYSEALKRFQQLKSGFPDSPPYTVWAELKVGDCHFFMKEYVEAIAAYEEFKKIHPTHEEMPYVQFRIGMAYFNQMLTLDRDQTFTKKALSNFEYLVANYPPSLFTEKAKERIEICRKRLADHEFYIGNFYYKHGNAQAASLRFQELLIKFPGTPEEDKTLFLLGKCYVELDQWEKAREAFTKLVTDYPKSSYYRGAKAILEQGLKEKKIRKSKKRENTEGELDIIPLFKFEEERRQSVRLNSPVPVTSKPVKSNPHPKAEIEIELKPEEENRMLVPPSLRNPPGEKENPDRGAFPDPGETRLVNTSQPIDIISDKVETYSKDNVIVFRGNVVARQKDIVIYADSIEAFMMREGKGIERVIASGDVRVQQGLRVANCQKAVFDNLDQKVIMTGDPRVWEGENIVSGDEIVFDIAQNRVEVRGGAGGRGKVKIRPGGEFEKIK